MRLVHGYALIAGATALALGGCGGGGGGSDSTTTAANGCSKVAAAKPKPDRANQPKPPQVLPDGRWTATVSTNCGSFTILLDSSGSPKTAASFAELSRNGFYDDLSFHRIAPGFVIQGGDPLGTGLGGPGYTTVERPSPDATYGRGTVAMAKSPDQPAGAAGSQFFIVTGEDAQLNPEYAILGTVTQGLDVVDRISAVGVDKASQASAGGADGPPAQPVVIEKIQVARGG